MWCQCFRTHTYTHTHTTYYRLGYTTKAVCSHTSVATIHGAFYWLWVAEEIYNLTHTHTIHTHTHTHAHTCTHMQTYAHNWGGSGKWVSYALLKNVTFLSGTSAALDFHFFSLLSTFFSAACHWLQTGAYKPRFKLFLQSTAQPYQSSEMTLEGKGVASHIAVTPPLLILVAIVGNVNRHWF